MIKIVLASDSKFKEKLEKAFREFLSDRVSVKCFSSADEAYGYIKNNSSDIFITDEVSEIDHKSLPEKCASAYFSYSANAYKINGERALFVYQNIYDIFNCIMNIIDCHLNELAEKEEKNTQNKKTRIYTFFSCTGGSGGSVFSKAFGIRLASQEKKVLYIPLEACTGANAVFTGEDSLSLSDIFHDISTGRDKKTIKKTISRSIAFDEKYKVHFIPAFYNINDAFSVTEENFSAFISLITEEDFQTVIFDADFSLPPMLNPVIKKSNSIVLVSNGTEHSNLATERIYNYICFISEEFSDKINIVYNRFVNGTSRIYTKNRINILGGVGKFSKSSRKYVMDSISKSEVFTNLR